jgi:hypothetical protein
MVHPDSEDVVVRQMSGNPDTFYLLGTPASPDQFSFRSRDEAVSKAIGYAKHAHVRAWFAKGDDDFVLLGVFQREWRGNQWQQRNPARSV